MKVMYGSDRVQVVADMLNSEMSAGQSLADIGARDEVLLSKMTIDVRYFGFDIFPIGDNSVYLDIEDASENPEIFDSVVALDVLEHTNDLERSTHNLLQMCKDRYIINLPNELWILYRFRLLLGIISGKFSIDLSNKDRHRWFFTIENVEQFIAQTPINETNYEVFAFYKKGRVLGRIAKYLSFLGLHGLLAHSFIIVGRK